MRSVFEPSTYVFLLLSSAFLSAVAGFLSWQSRPEDGAITFSAVMFCNTVIGCAMALLHSGSVQGYEQALLAVTMSALLVYALSWLLFGLSYTGRRDQITLGRIGGIGLIYVVYGVFVGTNQSHELVYTVPEVTVTGSTVAVQYSFGPLFWVMSILTAGFVVLGSYFLLVQSFRSRNVYRRINFLTGVGGLSMITVHVADILGLTPTPYFIDAPLLLGLWAVVSISAFTSVEAYKLIPIDPILSRFGNSSDSVIPLGRDFVIENIDDGLMVLDQQNRIVDINSTAKAVFGRKIIGDSIFTIAELADVLPGDTETTLDGFHDEVWLSTPDGERYFKITVTELQDGTGARAGYVYLMQDITELREREEELGLLKDTMSRFLRHNIRNQMNAARSRVTMLGENVHEDEQAFDETVDQAIDIMDKIVERSEKARYVERIVEDSGEIRNIELVNRVEFIIGKMLQQYPDVEFELDLDDEVWVKSSGHIDTAVENVVENAIEHNDSEPRIVRLSTERSADTVTLTLEDNGPGISPHETAVLEQKEETDLKHGSGFGLWLVDWILERSNGELNFDADGSGTTIQFTLIRGHDPEGQPEAETTRRV